ncbi:MAG: hypothetical protein HQ503_00130 [Rhodospirillales bacterium]|nr:hypothetical protein [Rhodospirillales bacterium]
MAPLAFAYAHGGVGSGDDGGTGLFLIYGLVLAGVAGLIIYRKWIRAGQSPEQRTLKRSLKDFERALETCLTQLQNAEDYPNECGLTETERRERLASAASIRAQIERAKAGLAAI